jgi:hypothetical protein
VHGLPHQGGSEEKAAGRRLAAGNQLLEIVWELLTLIYYFD